MLTISRPYQTTRGLSLLEILVCAAVISILAALLFSGFQKVREGAANARCISNLRGVGAAVMTYAGDHNGMILPRNLGLYRTGAKEPADMRIWHSRLINLGYIDNLDVFYCPSFFPRNAKEATSALNTNLAGQTYGMRTWLPPGVASWSSPLREEHKPLAAIETPSDFFLLVDTVWTHSSWKSQGYGISPEIPKEQLIHLRHQERANAFFADGHVEPKPASYFEELSRPDRQRKYQANRDYTFGTTTDMEF